ncbi:unnamed protein product [Notodromas monacha]|uniref:BRCT domain-containing protein n=1 Tax=Notodromas monacha TaxID=399045 RepID=A0A7R9BQF7_9CRUS|nr:unnamed protein product [Notodromas monacha]CAG0918916.1 unnamed protein product [Notodromas monacha]
MNLVAAAKDFACPEGRVFEPCRGSPANETKRKGKLCSKKTYDAINLRKLKYFSQVDAKNGLTSRISRSDVKPKKRKANLAALTLELQESLKSIKNKGHQITNHLFRSSALESSEDDLINSAFLDSTTFDHSFEKMSKDFRLLSAQRNAWRFRNVDQIKNAYEHELHHYLVRIGKINTLSQIYDYRETNLKTSGGFIVFLAFLINAPVVSVVLWYVVKRTKQCLDFAVTVHLFHFLACWVYNGALSNSLTWWLLQIICVAITCVCGEFLCMRTELAAIPVNTSPVADLFNVNMAPLSFEKVVSVSSENPNYPATNLLKNGSIRKWICGPNADGRAEVILQLSEASKITRVDIGNAGSAFVEVQVGNADTAEDSYDVLISASSFMTPKDSRNNENISLVKLYTKEKLQSVSERKWSRVKIICTQPFAKKSEFGISFISLSGDSSVPEQKQQQQKKNIDLSGPLLLGSFLLKPEEGSESKPKAAFKPLVSETGAGVVKNALKPGGVGLSPLHPAATSSRKRSPVSSPSMVASPKKLPRRDVLPGESPKIKQKVKEERTVPKEAKTSSKEAKNSKPEVKTEVTHQVDFHDLMLDVVFVLSGFENPLRSEIREKALEMGGHYSKDWNDNCTHLICAFQNTPKYREVKGKGYILRKEWIEHSFAKKLLMPWELYSFPDKPRNATPTIRAVKTPSQTTNNPVPPTTQNPTPTGRVAKTPSQTTKNPVPSTTRSRSPIQTPITPSRPSDQEEQEHPYECETDEDADTPERQENDAYDVETDTEDKENELKIPDALPVLPEIFNGKNIMLFGKFDLDEEKAYNRYVISHGGSVGKEVKSGVQLIITRQKWNDSFENILEENPEAVFILPEWVTKCVEEGKFLPYHKFMVSHE